MLLEVAANGFLCVFAAWTCRAMTLARQEEEVKGLLARMSASTILMMLEKGTFLSLVPWIRSSFPLRFPANRRFEAYSYPS